MILAIVFGGAGHVVTANSVPRNLPADRMLSLIQQFTAGRRSLSCACPLAISGSHAARREKSCRDELSVLAAMDFDCFSQEDKVDDLLLNNGLTAHLHQIAIEKHPSEQIERLRPFEKSIETFVDEKRLIQKPDSERNGALLIAMVKPIAETSRQLDPGPEQEAGSSALSGFDAGYQAAFSVVSIPPESAQDTVSRSRPSYAYHARASDP